VAYDGQEQESASFLEKGDFKCFVFKTAKNQEVSSTTSNTLSSHVRELHFSPF